MILQFSMVVFSYMIKQFKFVHCMFTILTSFSFKKEICLSGHAGAVQEFIVTSFLQQCRLMNDTVSFNTCNIEKEILNELKQFINVSIPEKLKLLLIAAFILITFKYYVDTNLKSISFMKHANFIKKSPKNFKNRHIK